MVTDLTTLPTISSSIYESIKGNGFFVYSVTEPELGYYLLVGLCRSETELFIRQVTQIKPEIEGWFEELVGHKIKVSNLICSQYQSGFGLTEFAMLFRERDFLIDKEDAFKLTKAMLPKGHRNRLFKLTKAMEVLNGPK